MARSCVVTAFVFLCGCAYLPDPPDYVHVVLFRLKAGSTAADLQALLEDSGDLLAAVPSVKGLHVGRPVPRPAVAGYDTLADYDLGVVFLFDSQRGLQDFVDHPAFQAFTQQHGGKFDARVIDFSPYAGPPQP